MKEMHWKNAEGLSLFAAHWDVSQPRAVIALVHGQGEHIGRYRHVAEWYNQHNIAVIGFDLQGYGRSAGRRGDAKNVEVLLDDIDLLLQNARSLYPQTPVFLYGHSMGGGLSLQYATRREPDLAGLIATGPWIRLAFEAPPVKVFAGRMLRRIFPTLALPTGLATRYLSRDENVVKAYESDPLVHDKLSAGAGISLMEGAALLNQWAGTFKFPVLLQHGTADQITSPSATRELALRAKGNVTYRDWQGFYHEIHNEKEQQEVFEYTLQWLKEVIAPA